MTGDQLKALESRLWKAADDLRANSKLTATEYSFPVLGIIFLRHAHNRFVIAKEELEEDELLVFDMLIANKKISDKEKAKVKEAARKLLERLKENEFKVDKWTEKTQTASAVRKVIENYLYIELPSPSYDDDFSIKAELLYNEFKTRYAEYGGEAA